MNATPQVSTPAILSVECEAYSSCCNVNYLVRGVRYKGSLLYTPAGALAKLCCQSASVYTAAMHAAVTHCLRWEIYYGKHK